jgi:predicted Fe-S protein YdhL (DUF1289 family)
VKGAARQLLRRAKALPAEGTVPSPCICVCRMDMTTGWCEGCFRTLDEVAAWTALDDGARRAVWKDLEHRARSRAGTPHDEEHT